MSTAVSEKLRIPVNGMEQGMFLRGRDRTKPVLLFLHGGPGMPEFFLDGTHPTGLEDDFVVAWWEQRGAGLSFSPDIAPQTMTVEQLVCDTIAVTNYLRERFGQDRIFLLGHSWGSFLGIQVAARAPELYRAYIGMGQVSHQQMAEKLAYDYAIAEYARAGDRGMVRKLRAAPVTLDAPIPRDYLTIRDRVMHRLGVGTTRGMNSVVTGVFIPVWQTRGYTISEKIDIGRGKKFSAGLLWDEFVSTDLAAHVRAFDLPVYFCVGRYDYTVNHGEARAYFDRISAPTKGFYTFEHSAHSPAFEEPERMRAILATDIVDSRATLADGGS